MDFLTDLAQRLLPFWRGLTETEQVVVGAVGAVAALLVLRSVLRALPGLAMAALLLVIGFVALRLVMPAAFCSVQWPAVVAFMCSR